MAPQRISDDATAASTTPTFAIADTTTPRRRHRASAPTPDTAPPRHADGCILKTVRLEAGRRRHDDATDDADALTADDDALTADALDIALPIAVWEEDDDTRCPESLLSFGGLVR